MASRTTTDDPALVTLTDFGVVLGLEAMGALDRGVVGVDARITVTGVDGRDREGLKDVETGTRGRDTDEGIERLVWREEREAFVNVADEDDDDVVADGANAGAGARVGFLADSIWRSRARRRDSIVLPEREADGVCGGTGGGTAAGEAVDGAARSARVPNLGSGSARAGWGAVWRGALRE
jgi:hypothetical protein